MENKTFVVLGGGHAGVEAAFAIARLGYKCQLITMSKKSIGRLSCNPAIGGLAKTHLVKEIDALGGIMGFAADQNSLQYKTLNKTKGRAVWSTRAQVDKKKYPLFIQSLIDKNKNIAVVSNEIIDIKTKHGVVWGVVLDNKKTVLCCALVVACGTFSNGTIHIGNKTYKAGRFGEKRSSYIGKMLTSFGHKLIRLKTGTPPRVSLRSIDLKYVKLASGDSVFSPFSLFSDKVTNRQMDCFLVNTNNSTHSLIEKNIHLSSMYSGKISGVGPRYCPSIEDKISRFKDRDSHHLFLEPEWLGGDQIYINGFSTSLPYSVQRQALKSIKAFKNVELIRPGYAIEYDVVPPRQLKASLESKKISGLFLCGQINGTSGYEEAAAQGLVAGINAVRFFESKTPLVLSRSLSYIGVMVDDLVTSHLDEPYRMFTSRAEHRLYLRPDNCYSRLHKIVEEFNILTQKQRKCLSQYLSLVSTARKDVFKTKVFINNKKTSLSSYLKRPNTSLSLGDLGYIKKTPYINRALFEVDTEIKYSGYIENELDQIKKNLFLESSLLPSKINYKNIPGLSNESKERLSKIRPETLGQASRIFGIRPTDITVLGVHTKSFKASRETKK